MKNQIEKTILHEIYIKLTENDVVVNSLDFSTKICGKYRQYYINSKRYNYDLTIETTINCVINIRKLLRIYKEQNSSLGFIHSEKITSLAECEEILNNYLRVKFRVKEIIDPNDPDYYDENNDGYDDNDGYYPIII